MRKLLTFLIALCANVVVVVSPASAQGFNGGGFNVGNGPFASGAAYTGPADAITSPVACWSLRACTSALRGQKVANVCNSTGGGDVCSDALSDATTGDLVSQSLNGGTCPGANCTVKTLYLQTGSLVCSTSCDLTQATVANRPPLTTSCGTFGKSFCMTFTAGSAQRLVTSGTTTSIAQPLTWIAVAMRTGVFTSNSGILSQQSNANELAWGSTANSDFIYAGLIVNGPSQTDSAWHSLQGVTNGTSSLMNVDGTSGSTGNAGATGIGTPALQIGTSSFTEYMTGSATEFLIYPLDFSTGGRFTTMCHNQFTYWGTATSC